MGYLYRRKLRDGTLARRWWAKYYVNGRPVYESTRTDKRSEAGRFLKEREGRVAAGQPVLPRVDRIRYEEIRDDLRRHYQITGRRDLKEAGYRLAHLDRFFRSWRVVSITAAVAAQYAERRQQECAANGTINRELAILNRMLRLAYEHAKLLRLPVIRLLEKENGPRQGFFERDQYEAVRRHLRADLQGAVDIAYTYGWRMQSEVLTLERRQLDLEAGTLRLDPGTTKNTDGRLVFLTPALKAALAAQVDRVRVLERQMGRIIPSLFPHLRGRRRGERIRDFQKAWRTACTKAGLPGMLRHDFRRTAVRNLVNAGVPERVAMAITGHRTRSVFDRYHIVSPGDLQEATRRLAVTFPVTPGPTALDSAPVSV